MEHTITFVTGDWSDDGHGKTHEQTYKTNLSLKEMKETYFRCAVKLGFDITKHCSDYEENKISSNIIVPIFELLGIEYEKGEEEQHIDSYMYIDIMLSMIALEDKAFNYEEFKSNNWNVGGYGLFY